MQHRFPNAKLAVMLFYLVLSTFTLSTAQVNISGIVNTYRRVTALSQPGCGCDPSCFHTITITSTAGFEVGDRALIIQMKGATINTTNSASAGAVTAINNAGNYEFFTIQSISGNVLTPRFPLTRNYTVSGVVQVVRIPSYAHVNIADTIKALEWEEANGIGGVVALYARRITMNAPIWVLGAGYQGQQMAVNGTPDNCTENPTTQFVLPNTNNSSWDKGQGIVVDDPNTNRGRAPRANGGGSGASGDTGGGGGSNYGAGGRGGKRWCDIGGADAGGIGGVSLATFIGDDRVFMGGAGGPGWVSTNNPSSAADGGGIVIIFADTIDGNGYQINARGTSPVAVNPVGAPDGGGGGGAGGTVVLKVKQFNGNLSLDLRGGDGQDLNTNIYHGPGGGGGGGTLLYSLSTLPGNVSVTVAGGRGGQHSDGYRNDSENGQNGGTFSLYVPIQNPNYMMSFDADAILAECDLDDDNDGIPDIAEAYTGDHDNDGIPDFADPDFCGAVFQGVNGWNCAVSGLPDPSGDMDGDGILNFQDANFPYCGGLAFNGVCRNMDADGDGNPNHADLDSDNDGIPDIVEAGGVDTNGDGFVDNNTDTDQDGLVNIYDNRNTDGPSGTSPCLTRACLLQFSTSKLIDANGDGVIDRYNDADGDGIPNQLDLDTDNDGIPDVVEAGGSDANGDGYIDIYNRSLGSLSQDQNMDGFTSVYQTTVCHDEGQQITRTSGIHNHVTGTTGITNPANAHGIPNADFAELYDNNDVYVMEMPVTATSFTFRVQNIGNNTGNGNLAYSLDGTTFSAAVNFNVTQSGGAIQNIVVNYAAGARFIRWTRTNGIDIRLYGVTITYQRDTMVSVCVGGTPLVVTSTDANADGFPESYVSGDRDNDRIPNFLDLDNDNDGIPDLVEAGGTDTNGDGVIDQFNRATRSFTGAGDADRDGFYNGFDGDDNNDGVAGSGNPMVLTAADVNGNGRPDEGYTRGDWDGDGIINIWDLDSDNDGIADIREAGGTDANLDGRVDNYNFGTGAFSGVGDPDRDGYSNLVDADLNNDGVIDNLAAALLRTGADVNNDTRPDSYPFKNADTNGLPNFLDLDADDDGITDVVEANSGRVSGAAYTDNPGGGVLDGRVGTVFADANTNGWHDASEARVPADFDGDGIPDYLDIDADNDGIIDAIEGVCTGCLGIAGFAPTADADGDGIVNVFDGIDATNAGAGLNQGVTPNEDDNDGDANPDYIDTDTDNDQANDWTEGYDLNNTAMALDDILLMAAAYEAANGNPGHYPQPNPGNDPDLDGIPAWLDNIPGAYSYVEATRPPFLTVGHPSYRDANGNGLVDIFDPFMNGVMAPLPDNDPGNDRDWRDANTFIPLPVDAIELSGNWNDNVVELTWSTLNERNVAQLVLERAAAPTSEFIALSSHAGTNQSVASYHSTDTNPLAFNYYRVRVVDYDGSTTFSNTVELRREGQSGSLIVGPNPASDVLNVRVPGSGPYQWRLVDATGRTVANGEALSAQFSLQLRNVVATGTYVLQVQNTDGQRFQHRVVLR